MSDEIHQLTGQEGGKWRVHTSSSHYDFDLDKLLVTRFRGPNASYTINDLTRPLRGIEQCRVGEVGKWTMRSGGGYLDADFFWQVTSVIRRIERLDGDDNAK